MPSWKSFSTRGRCPSNTSSKAFSRPSASMRIFPVLCASALHNIGTDLILNFIVENLPAPAERGKSPSTAPEHTPISESGPASAYVFKTTADPFAGRITFFKVYTGVVKNDANLQNVTQLERRAAGAPQHARSARTFSPSPSCTPAISARSPS